MIKYQFYIISIVALLMFSCTSKQKTKRNPYNLPIVNTMEKYRQQVKENPEMELVDLEKVIPNIILDIRYATANNFTKEIIYSEPKAYTRKPVAEVLKTMQDSLAKIGLGIKIYDAYRPYAATLKFYEVYPDKEWVANPAHGSRHNRGCAVDISLVNLTTGKELQMPTEFDSFSEKAHTNYPDLPEEAIKNRTFLVNIMAHFGFTNYKSEWWHYDYKTWKDYPLMDLTFEELGN